jgi:hypothetical protein
VSYAVLDTFRSWMSHDPLTRTNGDGMTRVGTSLLHINTRQATWWCVCVCVCERLFAAGFAIFLSLVAVVVAAGAAGDSEQIVVP